MEQKKVYLIEESSGQYSDYSSKIVAAYLDKSLAEVTCHQMNVELHKKQAESRVAYRLCDTIDNLIEELEIEKESYSERDKEESQKHAEMIDVLKELLNETDQKHDYCLDEQWDYTVREVPLYE